jgi:hypothetical protein
MEKIIKDNCLLCNNTFDWNEIIIWKMPENVWFCGKCQTKFEDATKYKWINAWLVTEYQKWTILEYKE